MSDSESSPASSEDETVIRPARNKTVPLRLRESVDLDVDQVDPERLVIVRCCQTGKKHTVRVKDLSNENALEPITESSFTENASLLMQYRGKSYPATFVEFKDKGKKDSGKMVDSKKTKNDKKKKSESEVEVEILTRAKDDGHKPPPSKKARVESSTMLDNSDKDLLVNVVKRLDKMEATLEKLGEVMEELVQLVKNSADTPSPSAGISSGDVKKEGGKLVVQGRNVMLLPARDAYAFGLQLLDIFFTKEELARSLLYKSKKSEKPELPREKVEKLIGCIETRYGSNWDLKTFTAKANQKCRDSSPKASEA